MAKTNLTLDTRRVLKDGTYPIKVVIYINRQTRLSISIGISIKKEEWNGQYIIKTPRKAVLNNILRNRQNIIDDELLRLELSGDVNKLLPPQIKKRILDSFNTSADEKKIDEKLIMVAFEEFAKTCKAERTKSIYQQTLLKLKSLYDMSTLRFSDITNRWLRDWEIAMLSDGLSVNAASIHLRNLRAVFNRAIDDDVISQEIYQFFYNGYITLTEKFYSVSLFRLHRA